MSFPSLLLIMGLERDDLSRVIPSKGFLGRCTLRFCVIQYSFFLPESTDHCCLVRVSDCNILKVYVLYFTSLLHAID